MVARRLRRHDTSSPCPHAPVWQCPACTHALTHTSAQLHTLMDFRQPPVNTCVYPQLASLLVHCQAQLYTAESRAETCYMQACSLLLCMSSERQWLWGHYLIMLPAPSRRLLDELAEDG